MKLIAAREQQDLKDAVFLMRELDIKSVEQLYSLVEKYTNNRQHTPKCYYFAQEAFDIYQKSKVIEQKQPKKTPSLNEMIAKVKADEAAKKQNNPTLPDNGLPVRKNKHDR